MGKNGGARPGAGRKSRAEEIKLIESLTPLAPEALKALEKGLKAGEFPFVKLFYEYYAGKPTDFVEVDGGISHELTFKVIRAPKDPT